MSEASRISHIGRDKEIIKIWSSRQKWEYMEIFKITYNSP
jgi:hypothetical protein